MEPGSCSFVLLLIGRVLRRPSGMVSCWRTRARELATLLDAEFRSKPLEHWKQVLDSARITYGLIQTPQEAAQDPQLHANGIVVPIADAGAGLDFTVGSPGSVY